MTLNKGFLAFFLVLSSLSIASYAFNFSDCVEYTYASTLAYCPSHSIKTWTCGGACKNLTGYEVYFTQEFHVDVAESLSFTLLFKPSAKKFVISYRGSIGGIELLMEALQRRGVPYELSDIPGALVDDYFYTHYVKTLRGTFLEQIKNAYKSYPDYEYIFTGHSLGAALTVLAAFDVVNLGIIPAEKMIVYNYGMPRLGNYIFAKVVERTIKQIYRVVHWKDLVPHLPFCMIGESGHCVNTTKSVEDLPGAWPAWHLGIEIFYNQDNSKYVACEGDGEDPNCSDQFKVAQTNVVDHLHYFKILMDCPKKMDFDYEDERRSFFEEDNFGPF